MTAPPAHSWRCTGYGDFSDDDDDDDEAMSRRGSLDGRSVQAPPSPTLAPGSDATHKAVAFAFGSADGPGWHPMTVYFVSASGWLFCLCPVLPAHRCVGRGALGMDDRRWR